MALYNSWHGLRSREDAAPDAATASAGDGPPGSQRVSEIGYSAASFTKESIL